MKRFTCFGIFVALLIFQAPIEAQITELFFSEYVEGSSQNKAVEIYNGTGAAVDFSTTTYAVLIYANGGTTPTSTITLAGTLANNDVFVLAHASASFAGTADQTSTSLTFNGNDAVVLRKSGTTDIDVIGQVGFDPGAEWGTGDTSTLDNTIRRKSTVLAGDPIGNDAFDPSIEWDGYPNGTFDGLGTHTVDLVTPTPSPTGPTSTPTITPTVPPLPNIMINEVYYDDPGTDESNFIEIYGPSGQSLDNVTVVLMNIDCTNITAPLSLNTYTIPTDGYFVIGMTGVANADLVNDLFLGNLQNGPCDGVKLVFNSSFDIDKVQYAQGLTACAFTCGETAAEPSVSTSDNSISRYPDHTDTNNNSIDFCETAISPGATNNSCFIPVTPTITPTVGDTSTPTASPTGPTLTPTITPTLPPMPAVILNEVYYDDPDVDESSYIELYGAAGQSLDGVSIVLYNDAHVMQGTPIPLDGQVIPGDNYFVIGNTGVANVDLINDDLDSLMQNGPGDGLELVFGGTVVMDALQYGTPYTVLFGEGTPVAEPFSTSYSLSRNPDHSDTGDNSVDFCTAALSPGAVNTECLTAGTPTATGTPSATPTGPTPTPPPFYAVKINEVYINAPGTDVGCFVELYYPGGNISLDGYSLIGINGYNDAIYNVIDLTGYAIPADGFFVIAMDATVVENDIIEPMADYQNGPDNIQLRAGASVIDAFAYGVFSPTEFFHGEGAPAPAYYFGLHSASRIPDGADTDDNSVDFPIGNLTAGLSNEGPPVPAAGVVGLGLLIGLVSGLLAYRSKKR